MRISDEFLKNTSLFLFLGCSLLFAGVSCHRLVSPAWVVLCIPYRTLLSSPDFINKLCKKKGDGNFDADYNVSLHRCLMWRSLCTSIAAVLSSCSPFEAAVCPCAVFPYAEAFVADSEPAEVFAFVGRCALGRTRACICVGCDRTRCTTAQMQNST